MKIEISRLKRDLFAVLSEHRSKLPYVGFILCFFLIYIWSQNKDSHSVIYKDDSKTEFKDARILGSQGDSLYENKERLLTKTMRDLQTAQATLRETTEKINQRLEGIEKGTTEKNPEAHSKTNAANGATDNDASTDQVHAGSDDVKATRARQERESEPSYSRNFRASTRSIISFPVKDNIIEKTESIAIPAGSYVKAKLMSGVEAPEGKTYPVLLQLDYAFIVPNKKKIDLSGCFMIAKSTGDLSIERVQMQTDKLSCVSKDGKMFEREVNGFIADDKDNSFAVIGKVNSKQDRVAAMAFLSSVVEGIGKAIQAAQTTQQTSPLGAVQSVIGGDQARYIAAGGAASAASMVTQWYLRQAQNLLPTINVGSGHDVWVIMKDTVRLPSDYFKKPEMGGSNENVFTYFSRTAE